MTINRGTFHRLGGYKWLVVVGVGVVAIAGCSSSSKSPTASTTSPTTSATPAAAATTVEVRTVSGVGAVLTNEAGHVLYMTGQDTASKIACTSSACTAIWVPLTVPKGQTPSAPSQLFGKVTTVQRPDGTTQVAFDGKPLYTFSFDHSAGVVTGNGAHDSFNGTNFTWHAAAVTGAAATTPPASTSTTPGTGTGPSY